MSFSGFPSSKIKAIALLSGGLDSTIAAALIKRAGIDTVGFTVRHLFGGDCKRTPQIKAAASAVGIRLIIRDLSEGQLEVVRRPRYGYGAGMNPCIDCRIFMLKAAKQVMAEEGAQFVVTGEVLGQRPMSQHYRALMQAAEESGLEDLLLRPLSANLLPDTLPVKEGWLEREDLLSLCGRGRREQMALAEELGIVDYPSPGGGCILVEKAYSARLRDAFAHHGKDAVGVNEFLLLRYGRHFRLSDRIKVIVGRDEAGNEALCNLAPGRILIEPLGVMGPTTLIEGDPVDDELGLAAALAARYCDHSDDSHVSFRLLRPGAGEETAGETIIATPLSADDPRISSWRISP